MSSQSSILTKICIAILLANNIGLCILLLHKLHMDSNCIPITQNNYLYENISSHYASIQRRDIKEFLEHIDCPVIYGQALAMIVPPYPCDACLIEQSNIFQEYITSYTDYQPIIICPDYRDRDMRVRFSKKNTVRCTYECDDTIKQSIVSSFDGVVFITLCDNNIENMYITNKLCPSLTNIFFEHIK